MDLQSLIQERLIDIDLQVDTAQDAIRSLGKLLVEAGYVEEGYIEEAVKREAQFPTGLPTQEIGVAIPHTSAEHVLRSAIAVGILLQPVSFGAMGNPGQFVEARIVFLLAIREPSRQVNSLQQLVALFQNTKTLLGLATASSPTAAYQLIVNDLRETARTP